MSAAAQTAIDAIKTALEAVDWATACGVPSVLVDATPGRAFTIQERREKPILHLFGGRSNFNIIPTRQGKLQEQPTIFVSTIFHLGFEPSNGAVDLTLLGVIEGVLMKALTVTRDTLIASTLGFVPTDIERLERYDPDHMTQGDFVSTLAFTVTANGSL